MSLRFRLELFFYLVARKLNPKPWGHQVLLKIYAGDVFFYLCALKFIKCVKLCKGIKYYIQVWFNMIWYWFFWIWHDLALPFSESHCVIPALNSSRERLPSWLVSKCSKNSCRWPNLAEFWKKPRWILPNKQRLHEIYEIDHPTYSQDFFLLETFWFTEHSLHCPFYKNQDTESAKHVASRPKEVQEQRVELFLQLLYVAVLWWWPDLSRLLLEECAFSTQSSWSSLSSLGSGQVQNMPKLSKSEVELTPTGKSMSRWVEIPKLGCDNPKQYWACVYINIICIVYIIFRKKT
jgi:hypothetical protein